jgi:hypothetical protein
MGRRRRPNSIKGQWIEHGQLDDHHPTIASDVLNGELGTRALNLTLPGCSRWNDWAGWIRDESEIQIKMLP